MAKFGCRELGHAEHLLKKSFAKTNQKCFELNFLCCRFNPGGGERLWFTKTLFSKISKSKLHCVTWVSATAGNIMFETLWFAIAVLKETSNVFNMVPLHCIQTFSEEGHQCRRQTHFKREENL